MTSFIIRIKTWTEKVLNTFRKASLKKKILILGSAVIVGVILTRIAQGGNAKKGYTTAKVSKNDIIEIVSDTGNIVASGKVDMYSTSNGIVEEVYVQNGDIVAEDQALFKIKSTATEQEKAAALANYLAAKNSLNAANATAYSLRSVKDTAWKKFYDLATSSEYENDDGSPRNDNRNSSAEFQSAQADWLAAESNFKNQTGAISQAQAAVTSTYLLYQATQNVTIKAQMGGTISNLSVTNGSSVQAQSPTATTQPLASISNAAITEVVVSLSENDIAKVQEDQPVVVEVKAVDDRTFTGIVRRVDTIGTSQQGVIRYNVYIEVTDATSALRAGMNVDVKITTNKLEKVLSVPNSAVKPYKGSRAVRIADEKGIITYVPVEIGIRGDQYTQIIKGINEGQEVITSLSNDQIKKQGLFGN